MVYCAHLNDSQFKEALKINFDHAKLWENYMLLCLRTHDYSSAIASYHHLLDLDKRYQDEDVLEKITDSLIVMSEVSFQIYLAWKANCRIMQNTKNLYTKIKTQKVAKH